LRFVHEMVPQRVVFAPGEAPDAVAAELAAAGKTKVMLIASEREAELAAPIAEALPLVVQHDEVVMHVPIEVASRARAVAEASGADVIVTVGGGSTTGLGKAVAMTTGLPIIAVPTTYAGSEATSVWGLTHGDVKTTGVDVAVLPRAIVYDADLLTGLPREMAVASGLNAMAHCVDAMWGPRSDPIDRVLAQEGIRGLTSGLLGADAGNGGALGDRAGVGAVEMTLYGAYLAAVAFSSAGSGLHHKICHVLGGMFDLPHAQTHAVVLPHVLAFNAPNAPEAEHRIAEAYAPLLGTNTALDGLEALRAKVGVTGGLKDYGMPAEGIAKAVEPILEAVPAGNPTTLTASNLEALLRRAWEGSEPVQDH
jgi:maleylacetate reductase